MIASLSKEGLHVQATGISYSIVEVGELLAWLGAALQLSQEEGITYCVPLVDMSASGKESVMNPETPWQLQIRFHYNFEIESFNGRSGTGSCWRKLFRRPVVVKGYPIPRRSEVDTGLEVSLDIMVGLTNARRIVDFYGATFLKGFSALLIVTKLVGDVVRWHLFFNEDGHYISYSDPQVPRHQNSLRHLSSYALESSRHILGWCETIKNCSGKSSLPKHWYFAYLLLIAYMYRCSWPIL